MKDHRCLFNKLWFVDAHSIHCCICLLPVVNSFPKTVVHGGSDSSNQVPVQMWGMVILDPELKYAREQQISNGSDTFAGRLCYFRLHCLECQAKTVSNKVDLFSFPFSERDNIVSAVSTSWFSWGPARAKSPWNHSCGIECLLHLLYSRQDSWSVKMWNSHIPHCRWLWRVTALCSVIHFK